ncbi:hypothetical protein [Flaviaesturariibacter amylovorans]
MTRVVVGWILVLHDRYFYGRLSKSGPRTYKKSLSTGQACQRLQRLLISAVVLLFFMVFRMLVMFRLRVLLRLVGIEAGMVLLVLMVLLLGMMLSVLVLLGSCLISG